MRIHFIAIGGSAMHNLALALHEKGDIVSGSDDAIFEPSKSNLEKKGLLPNRLGWFAEQIDTSIDVVILGMHAKKDNPELLKAQELGIKVMSYPEFIYEHSKGKTRVVIGGSHGKTTITSMVLHVMNYHDIQVDYLVGAQLPGFERMVNLTQENDFILIEGDEYLSSAIDPRPKFHIYKPNIALISGIAWDHINVFPSFQTYKEQFAIFVSEIVNGGMVIFNSQDQHVVDVVENTSNPIRKIPYDLPQYSIDNGVTYLETNDGAMPLEVFGEHNLSNLGGAKWVCQNMGIDEDDFFEAIGTFKGAAKRLEKLQSDPVVFKDFAHSPSKVHATCCAVKAQFPTKKLIAVLELHTYSSLNASFLEHYIDTLQASDQALVFYSKDALELKGLSAISETQIVNAFNKPGLVCFTDSNNLKGYLSDLNTSDSVVLFMSSGNYGGLDLHSIYAKK